MIGPRGIEIQDGRLGQPNRIEVLCACDHRYLPHTATMLGSLLQHNSFARIHLFHGKVDQRQLAKLNFVSTRYKSQIIYYDLTTRHLEGLRVDGPASIANYYRLLAPQLLPIDIDKVVYLDSDIVVRRSLANLWNVDLADYALAAVEDQIKSLAGELGLPAGARYFNSGVLLINLAYWRAHKVHEQAFSFILNNPLKVQYWDQDALNAILVDRWKELPDIWNWNEQYAYEAKYPLGDPAIVHFCGVPELKPWHWHCRHPFRHEYRQHRRKTPWWRYRLEGGPGVLRRVSLSLRGFARMALPAGMREWLRPRVKDSRL
jgi:lipopolysaccharide biosynthesis glycosyltransferase